jgi:hypothetical protein
MHGLSEDIDANISFEVKNGTKITILFKLVALSDPESLLKLTEIKETYV